MQKSQRFYSAVAGVATFVICSFSNPASSQLLPSDHYPYRMPVISDGSHQPLPTSETGLVTLAQVSSKERSSVIAYSKKILSEIMNGTFDVNLTVTYASLPDQHLRGKSIRKWVNTEVPDIKTPKVLHYDYVYYEPVSRTYQVPVSSVGPHAAITYLTLIISRRRGLYNLDEVFLTL